MLVLLAWALILVAPETARGRHRARLDPAEAIFTQRPFVEKDLEISVGWEKASNGNLVEFALAGIWVFWKRLEIELEIPTGLQIPDDGPTSGDLSDVGFATQLLLCCEPAQLLDYFSLRGEVAAPTGDRDKDVGGTGEFGFSVLAGRLVTVTERLPDVFVQLQLSYFQAIRLSRDDEELARELGLSETPEKDFIWNIAFTQSYLDGRIRPAFELLGTTIVDALVSDDEGTIFELGVGMWIAPFPDASSLAPVSFGCGYRWPLTSRRDSFGAAAFMAEWAFDL